MIRSNVASRIVKLEAGQRRPDEILLVWRKPDADIAEAISGASFRRGDKVICAEWFGDLPLPAPRWYRDSITSALGDPGTKYLVESMRRIVDAEPSRDPAFAPPPPMAGRRLCEFSDNELLHAAIGIAT